MVRKIADVNSLSREEFESVFKNVVEHCPEAARHVETSRPFATVEALKECFDDYLDKIDIHEKKTVLVRHPDLAGKLTEASLTVESQYEQKSAGIETMTSEERQTLTTYNRLYKEKFLFPFVICARENKIKTILSSIQIRLQNAEDTEVHQGIEEVKKICKIRISDIVD